MLPNQILLGVALFLTVFVMAPTWTSINDGAVQPYLQGGPSSDQALQKGSQPLRDFMLKQTRERDLALDKLAQLAPISTTDNPNGSVDLLLDGHGLVQGFTADSLTTTAAGSNGFWEVHFGSDNALAGLGSGELHGLIDSRDQAVPKYLTSLDRIASSLINAVNGLHTAGFGLDEVSGRPFFAGTNAATMAVDPAIAADPSKIAAADAANQAGNSATALAIAQLRDTMSPTSEAAYGTLVATLGADLQSTRDLADNQAALVQSLDRRRQSVSGVSLDEEGVQLLRYQRAYEASARLITATDQLLDKLINDTGLAGR